MKKNNVKVLLLSFILLGISSLYSVDNYKVETSKGNISVWDTRGDGLAIFMIHGNSASGKAFKKQFESDLQSEYRLIAPDLPGHGNSDFMEDESVYSFPGYAAVLAEVITKLGLEEVVVVGWSLGGHIALELSLLLPEQIKGTLITGTPPIEMSQEGIMKGFKPFDGLHLLGHEPQFTPEEAKMFVGLGGVNTESEEAAFMVQDAIDTKGAARKHMFGAMGNGVGHNEVAIVRDMKTPLAIVAGEEDKGINNEYIQSLEYGCLWGSHVCIVKDAGHAVFWENHEEFNALLHRFLNDVFKK